MKLKKTLLVSCLLAVLPSFAFANNVTDVAKTVHLKYPATASVPSSSFAQAGPLYTFPFAGQRVYTNADASYLLVGGELLSLDPATGKMTNYTVKNTPNDSLVNVPASSQANQFDEGNFTSIIGKPPFKETLPESDLSPQNIQNVWKALPWDRTITYVYGKGERHIFVLEDPDCPFCANMEKSMEALGPSLNATVSILPMVLPMHEKEASHGFDDGTRVLKGLMCSNDFATNWRAWMMYSANNIAEADGTTPKSPASNWVKFAATHGLAVDNNCPATSAIPKNLQVAKNLGLSGTPTVIYSNGVVLNGVPDNPKDLLDLLNKGWTFVAEHPVINPVKNEKH